MGCLVLIGTPVVGAIKLHYEEVISNAIMLLPVPQSKEEKRIPCDKELTLDPNANKAYLQSLDTPAYSTCPPALPLSL